MIDEGFERSENMRESVLREVILVGASWCAACKAMKDWFYGMQMEGVTFRYSDVEAFPDICSLPVVLFKEDGETVNRLDGRVSKEELIYNIMGLWAD
jgi:thiol-disulfide isomerase/thioredoxin